MKFNQKPLYKTALGSAYVADSLNMLSQIPDESIDLVMTSPPFALQRKKEYGNKEQEEYVEWLAEFAKLVFKKLKPTGSFVIDLGGAYQKGKPVRSLYNYRVLIKLCDELGFHLAEEFFWHNPSKLPSPIEWVNKRKIRAKDSVNTVWWLSKTEFPNADISQVLTEYSDRMKKLIADPEKYYTPAKRPSGHDIGTSFGKDNGGAIPSNLLQISNSEASSQYLKSCKAVNVKAHPARFPAKLPEFFIKFLTKPDDIVVDIFAGSNTTGFVCEQLNRRWLSFELNHEYLATSIFRFSSKLNDVYDLYPKLLLNAEADINL
ncbi:site-specific DNA-methyltransferase [Pasteurella canis]|uniref:DNA-methyltransferase n=1 Tax=Pasteurella canis TaxID=753 RepID=UPI001D0FE559|nr:site-specific DNA-methyltransferase [Pasteurella canis]UDW83389.1 site-specific DNA-methyltransferase [Pasteurella canis]